MILPTDRQKINRFQEHRAPSHRAIVWEDKHHNSERSPLPPSSPSFYCWAQCPVVWNVPFISRGQLSQLCPLPTSCAPQPTHWQGSMRSRKGLGAVQALFSNDSNTGVLSTLFSSEI